MSYRVRHRTTRRRRGLSGEERHYLMSGHVSGAVDGSYPFSWRDPAGDLRTDESEARAAWREHRDELLAEAALGDLIPWAARRFEGMAGQVHPYEHLRGPSIERRH